jgi:GxxExxY protein
MKLQQLTSTIIQCAFTVHNTLGAGFIEPIYRNALVLQLINTGLKAEKELPIRVLYDQQVVGYFSTDITVADKVILELKAVHDLNHRHEVQLVNYLKATGCEVGLLINFGERVLVKRRILDLSHSPDPIPDPAMPGDLTGQIIAAALKVHNTLGFGFLESVYCNALAIELGKRGISSEKDKPIAVNYNGLVVGEHTPDLVAGQEVLISVKSVSELDPKHETRLSNHLKSTGYHLGLLLNFGPSLQVKKKIF